MRRQLKVRFWLIAPFLLYLVSFLLWLPRWQHAPQSASARLLGVLLLAMTAILAVFCLVGKFVSRWDLGPFVQMAIQAYQTFFRSDPNTSPAPPRSRKTGLTPLHRPHLLITQRMKDGTPVRAACPWCAVEFSSEAFDQDMTYPHQATLEKDYAEHFESHLAEDAS